jgi:hypothetical protein
LDNVYLVLLAIVVVFLLLREFWCWYFKISKRSAVLIEIRDLLEKSYLEQQKTNFMLSNSSIVPDEIRKSVYGDEEAKK